MFVRMYAVVRLSVVFAGGRDACHHVNADVNHAIRVDKASMKLKK